MTFTEAAAVVLRLVGKPLHYKEITDVAIEKNLLSHVGKSPEVTMGARLNALHKKSEKDSPLVRVEPGVFALREWDERRIEEGLRDRTPALDRISDEELALLEQAELSDEGELLEKPLAIHAEVDDEATPPDEEERHRAELSASATELFASEDDDDRPIFAAPEEPAARAGEEGDDADADARGKRRRRRRRGRGRREEEGTAEGEDDLPTYTVSDASPEEVFVEPPAEIEAPRAVDASSDAFDRGSPEAGADLASLLEKALQSFDRGRGPVAAQTLADQVRRRFKSEGALHGQSLIAVALADARRAEAQGTLPRFRVSGNRIAPLAWSFDRKSDDKYRGLIRALEQTRESTVRALAEQLVQLSHKGLGELVLVLLDRMGFSNVEFVRRPGAHGSELHIAATLPVVRLDVARSGLEQKVAVVLRRDGRDIGRERVTELRGTLHHYGPASHGWLLTTGQVLSGAREEAASSGATPVSLAGRAELAELCVEYGVGVRRVKVDVPTLDTELFEAIAGRG